MAKPKKGDKAPSFTLLNADEGKVKLSDYKGKWVVLYFYPKDNTPGCTIEAKDFSKAMAELRKLDAEVIGVSADSCSSHVNFIKKHKLKINLLSDESKEMLKKYGIWQKKKMMGKEFMGIVRSTFIVDPKGKIAYIWDKVKVNGHVGEVKKKLKELQRA